jgi:large subunit ribosomal protein L21
MYAVIRVGGKQERVKPGDVIEVEFMHVDPGSSVEFDPMVVMDDDGKAHHGKDLRQAKVVATLLGDKKGDKIKVFKYRPKSGYRRTQGHRQLLTLLEIQEVALDKDRVARKEEPPAEEAAPAKPARQKPAAKKAAAGREGPAKKAAARKPAASKKATGAKKPSGRKPPAAPAAETPAQEQAGDEAPSEGRASGPDEGA